MKKLLIGAMLAASIVGASAGVASAQCPDSAPPDVKCAPLVDVEVLGTTIDAPVAVEPAAVAAAAPAVAAKAQLPVTGVETGVLAGAGLALIAGGGLLVLRSRKGAIA